MNLQELVESYINGNISDCKKSAKNRRMIDLINAFVEWGGHSRQKAILTSNFLKTGHGWQHACDCE